MRPRDDEPCLLDTSVWIEYLRATGSSAHLEVRRLLQTLSLIHI